MKETTLLLQQDTGMDRGIMRNPAGAERCVADNGGAKMSPRKTFFGCCKYHGLIVREERIEDRGIA